MTLPKQVDESQVSDSRGMISDGAEVGFDERDEETVAAGVRRRQYRGYLIHLPVTVPSISGLSLLLLFFFYESEWRSAILACVAGVACVEIASLVHAFVKRNPLTYISRFDIGWVAVRSALLGFLLLLPIALLFHKQPVNTQLVIVAIVAALIGTGGFVLSPVLNAAIGWTLATGGLAAVALVRANQPIFDLTLALLACYCFIVLVVSRLASTNYLIRIRAESRNARQREVVDLLLKDFEGSARDWLWDTDQAGHLRHVSVRLVEAFGQERQALEKLSLVDLLRESFPDPSRDATEAHDFLQLRLASRRAFRDQVVPVMVSGGVRWWSLSAKPLFDEDGQHTGWRGVGSDVTDARRREIEMTQLANFDALTGLANRRRFHAVLSEMLGKLNADECIDLYIFDLDNFKSVNDRLGHGIGDEVLRAVADKLLRAIDETEVLCRLGGDEYALISRQARNAVTSMVRGNALLAVIGEPFELRNNVIEIRASVGIARAPEHGSSVDSLMKAADAALYAAKDAGRGRVSVYDHELDDRAVRRAQLQDALVRAVNEEAFELHYQPQIDTRSMEVIGFEALIRWRRNGTTMLSPLEFIPLAEETGLIIPIGRWVLQKACRDCAQWPSPLFVAVNFSAVQFASRTLFETVERALTESGLDPTRLELEITESSLVEDSLHARETLALLREKGLRIALDDFGTGYSSLAYLRNFPIDRLKIDGAFTAGLLDDAQGEASAIVRAIVQLATALKLRTTAEGVETKMQLDALRARGCFESQGFYFARPMPGQDVPAFLEAWASERLALRKQLLSAE